MGVWGSDEALAEVLEDCPEFAELISQMVAEDNTHGARHYASTFIENLYFGNLDDAIIDGIYWCRDSGHPVHPSLIEEAGYSYPPDSSSTATALHDLIRSINSERQAS